ncbi:hypothetical protein [Sphingorhabdus sp.]|jgi:hypothetical protein|uniref:hypothetical protein n=1 Tax=Sphingorhabdus sp. TaxID=1902408 RepID=UPI0035B42706
MTIKLVTASALSLLGTGSAMADGHEQAYMPGVWSLGETKNCESGPAWAFLADGYYAEVTLPNKGPTAIGLWKDEGTAIAYTHSHMPFGDMMKANEMKRLTVEKRTPDKLVTKNYRGVTRIFHRCQAGALKVPSGQPAH